MEYDAGYPKLAWIKEAFALQIVGAYDQTFSRYEFVDISKEEPSSDIFRIIGLHEVSLVVVS